MIDATFGIDRSFRSSPGLYDEATEYCLAIKTERHLQHTHVKALLREMISRYGRPRAIRCDNSSELPAQALREEMKRHKSQLANIDAGKPWQNGNEESFDGKFRKECLNAEIFASLTDARVVIEQWRRRYNERRSHAHKTASRQQWYILDKLKCETLNRSGDRSAEHSISLTEQSSESFLNIDKCIDL